MFKIKDPSFYECDICHTRPPEYGLKVGVHEVTLCNECIKNLDTEIQNIQQHEKLDEIMKTLKDTPRDDTDPYQIWTSNALEICSDANVADFINANPDSCLGLTLFQIKDTMMRRNRERIQAIKADFDRAIDKVYPDGLHLLIAIELDAGLDTGVPMYYNTVTDATARDIFQFAGVSLDSTYNCDGHDLTLTQLHDGKKNYVRFRKIKPEHRQSICALVHHLEDKEMFDEMLEKYTEPLWPLLQEIYKYD